jgi:hypothetical protein
LQWKKTWDGIGNHHSWQTLLLVSWLKPAAKNLYLHIEPHFAVQRNGWFGALDYGLIHIRPGSPVPGWFPFFGDSR